MAHLRPLTRETKTNPEVLKMFDQHKGTYGFVPKSMLTMRHWPTMVMSFDALNEAILCAGTVSEELKLSVHQ